MKWVKHMTNCSNDPKIRLVRAQFGNDGYAAYWLIIETIAAEYSRDNKSVELTFPPKVWAKICEISAKKLQNFLEFCQKINLIEHKYSKTELTIRVPNLLKFGDEYTRKQSEKSGQNPESSGQDSGQAPDLVRASTSTSTSTSTSPFPSTGISTGYITPLPEFDDAEGC